MPKETTMVETTKTIKFSHQELNKILNDLGLIPKGWIYYSITVTGLGVSSGAEISLSHTEKKDVD
jgi:hypothetical protein